MALNSKQKGKRGELELCLFLRQHGFTDARRGLQYNGSDGSADIVCKSLAPYHIECKRTETVHLEAWLKKAIEDCGTKTPVVMHKRSRGEWVAIMRLDDLLKIIGGW